MGIRLASSKERRLQAFRRALTVDLFTRHGLFWDRVHWIRDLQRIDAERRMPPPLDPWRVHRPPWLQPSRDGPRQVYEQGMHEWMVLLNVLHDAIVPPDLHIETPYSYSLDFWMGFLSACVVYDPPPDDLLDFADHGIAAYGDFVNPFDPEGDGDGPEMLAPPIRHLPDPERLLVAEQERFDWVLGRMQAAFDDLRLTGGDEVDLREMAAHFEYVYRSQRDEDRRIRDEPPPVPTQPYIAIDEFTTEEDVRHAYRLMASALPSRPRAIRPKRDRLIELQCALWYDACGWSHEQIGRRMEWKIQYSAHAKPRCETARQYIVSGRAMPSQRNVAA